MRPRPWLPLLALLLAAPLGCAGRTHADHAAPGAAKFEMQRYFVVLLRRGPHWAPASEAGVSELFAAHMAHLQAMTAAGHLVLVGPFELPEGAPEGAPAGLCVYRVASDERARDLASADPAVAAGRFTVEVRPWYGPAGIDYPGREDFAANGPGL